MNYKQQHTLVQESKEKAAVTSPIKQQTAALALTHPLTMCNQEAAMEKQLEGGWSFPVTFY